LAPAARLSLLVSFLLLYSCFSWRFAYLFPFLLPLSLIRHHHFLQVTKNRDLEKNVINQLLTTYEVFRQSDSGGMKSLGTAGYFPVQFTGRDAW
jgi:hypothetical protein